MFNRIHRTAGIVLLDFVCSYLRFEVFDSRCTFSLWTQKYFQQTRLNFLLFICRIQNVIVVAKLIVFHFFRIFY